MYAIVELKGKQFPVTKNESIFVDLLESDCVGKTLSTDKVLLIKSDAETQIGTPYVSGATVSFEVQKEVKGEKLIAFKYRHNKNSKSKKGHRQRYHKLLITDIKVNG